MHVCVFIHLYIVDMATPGGGNIRNYTNTRGPSLKGDGDSGACGKWSIQGSNP